MLAYPNLRYISLKPARELNSSHPTLKTLCPQAFQPEGIYGIISNYLNKIG